MTRIWCVAVGPARNDKRDVEVETSGSVSALRLRLQFDEDVPVTCQTLCDDPLVRVQSPSACHSSVNLVFHLHP